ncbi:MAG: GNAT family N-acetyltransferase [Paludibacteraceae bacterium]|nr:GNAT family N-acetyltransferase [Paludibacteraceae bacterium]
MMTHIRKIQKEEIPVLDDFLYEAIFIPQGVVPPPRSIIEQEDLQLYVRGFGESPHDHCLVAECDGKIVGAVWVRVMDDYGHVDNQTPSLAISLYPDYRGQGIGTQLLHQMMELLRQQGYAQVSLSVQKENYALRMYQKAGFEIVEDRGEELLMLAQLPPPRC